MEFSSVILSWCNVNRTVMKGFRILFTLSVAVLWGAFCATWADAQTAAGRGPKLRGASYMLSIKQGIAHGKLSVQEGGRELDLTKPIEEDKLLTVVPKPEAGYRVKTGSLKYTFQDNLGQENVASITDNNTFKMPAYDITLEAVFVKGLTLDIQHSSAGHLETEKVEDLKAGDMVTLTAVPDEGMDYDLKRLRVEELQVTGDVKDVKVDLVDEKSVKFTMPGNDVQISLSFYPATYKATLSSSKGGRLVFAKGVDPSNLHFKEEVRIAVKPDLGGYQLVQGGLKWRKAGAATWETVDYKGDPEVVLIMPSGDLEVKAEFERDPSTLKSVLIGAEVRGSSQKEKRGTVALLDKDKKPLKDSKVKELDTVWVECKPEPGWKFQAAQHASGIERKSSTFKFQIPEKQGNVVVMVWFQKETAELPKDKRTAVESDARLTVYPNPCEERIHVMADGVKRLQLFNLGGALVLERNRGGEVELGQLPAGVYVLRVHFEDGSEATHRIVRR